MQKCATTALASWLVRNGIAEYMLHRTKESYHFQNLTYDDLQPPMINEIWRLDASVGYWPHHEILEKIASKRVKVILAFRNYWDRTWSAYVMNKEQFKVHGWNWKRFAGGASFDTNGRMISSFDHEIENLLRGDFLTRIQYELEFFRTHGKYPHMSILQHSQFSSALTNVLQHFTSTEVICVNVESLSKEENRDKLALIFNKNQTPDTIIPELVSSSSSEKPNFAEAEFLSLRSVFRKDFEILTNTISQVSLDCSFINFDVLDPDF